VIGRTLVRQRRSGKANRKSQRNIHGRPILEVLDAGFEGSSRADEEREGGRGTALSTSEVTDFSGKPSLVLAPRERVGPGSEMKGKIRRGDCQRLTPRKSAAKRSQESPLRK